MLELTEKRLAYLLWMLKNKEKKWSIYELQKKAAEGNRKEKSHVSKKASFSDQDKALTYGPTFTFVKELEKNGHVVKDSKTTEYRVTKVNDILKLISLARPFASLKTNNYYSPHDFSKTLKVIHASKLPYAFTLFAGSELYNHYVKTDQVHTYIHKDEEENWNKYLLSQKFLKASKNQANLFLIPLLSSSQESFFRNATKLKGFSVAPAPILLADLLSFGGLAE